MLRDQVAAFGHDLVSILHNLELLVTILLMEPHTLADHFEDVNYTEWPVAFVSAQFAMIGMIDRNQCSDGGSVMDAASILFVIFVIGIGTVALWPGERDSFSA